MRRAALTGVPLLALSTLVFCSCPQEGKINEVADAGLDQPGLDAKVDSDSPVDAGEPWDPVWHETTPKDWPKVGPEGQPDCGPGCRIALNGAVDHNWYYGHAYTDTAVADVNGTHLLWAPQSKSVTSILASRASPSEAFVQQYLHNEFAIFVRAQLTSSGKPVTVEVLNTLTGENKVVYSYIYAGQGDLGVSLAALNSKYAFWMREGTGLMSRNLQTGEVRVVAAGDFSCMPICTSDSTILCGDYLRGTVLSIDPESGTVSALDDGHALQTDVGCSVDRSQVAWIDYRDPPGQASDSEFNRNGGEVYMRDLQTNQTRRLTFDSPSAPKGKIYASIGHGLVLWHEVAVGTEPNPKSAQELYGTARSLVVLDLSTSKKCRIDLPVVYHLTTNSIHGRHVYGYWSPPGGGARLVDIDLDNPAIECKPYQ